MSAVIHPLTGLLARLGLVIFIGSGLAFGLGLLYPVQRTLDLGRFDQPSYAYEVQGVFPASTASAVETAIGQDSCLVSLWQTALTVGPAVAGPTELDAVAPGCAAGVSRFPSSALVAESSARPGAWVDLNADAARTLGVWTGDTVSAVVGPGVEPVQLMVRDIYAVRAPGSAFAAMAPAELLFDRLPPDAGAGYSTMLTSASPSQVETGLASSPVVTELEQAKGYPPAIVSTDELAMAAAEDSATSLGLVRTIGALAALGVVFLAAREYDVFRRRATPTLVVIHRLGGPLRRSIVVAFSAATLVVLVALTAAEATVWKAYSAGWLASCFPPGCDPPSC